MKKFNAILLVSAAAAVALSSCTKDNVLGSKDVELVPMTFETSTPTKTVLNNDRSIKWSANDKISIFDGAGNQQFIVDADLIGVFSGNAAEVETYYALYPYAEAMTFSNNTIQGVKLSQGSAWCPKNTFPKDRNFMAAVSQNGKLQFKHLFAYLKVHVPEDVTDLKEIVVFSASSKTISGVFDVVFDADGNPSITNITEGKNQVGITGPDGGVFPAGADYYIAILPVELTAGFNVKCNYTDGFVSRGHTGAKITPKAGEVINIGSVQKTNAFNYATFEDGKFNSNFAAGNDGPYEGTRALGVIPNAHKTDVNPSEYVLDDNMTPSSSGTSGYFDINMPSASFSDAVKDKYNIFRVKIWLGGNAYVPMVKLNGGGNSIKPRKVNGQTFSTEAEFKALVKSDEWNIFEWQVDDMSSGKTNFSSVTKLQMRPFSDWNGNGTGKDETHNRTVLFDDFQFILK